MDVIIYQAVTTAQCLSSDNNCVLKERCEIIMYNWPQNNMKIKEMWKLQRLQMYHMRGLQQWC